MPDRTAEIAAVGAIGPLADLRWQEDMEIVNYEGERVWLGPCLNASGERIGITDCCLVSDPCTRHADMRQKAVS